MLLIVLRYYLWLFNNIYVYLVILLFIDERLCFSPPIWGRTDPAEVPLHAELWIWAATHREKLVESCLQRPPSQIQSDR